MNMILYCILYSGLTIQKTRISILIHNVLHAFIMFVNYIQYCTLFLTVVYE